VRESDSWVGTISGIALASCSRIERLRLGRGLKWWGRSYRFQPGARALRLIETRLNGTGGRSARGR
jgi:hypothetical protein